MATLETHLAPLLKSDGTAIDRQGKPICWLDELLEGGINAPDDLGRPLIILVCGPPGAGKSLLLQQVGYTRALNAMDNSRKSPEEWQRTVLISTEVSARALVDNMSALGMPAQVDDAELRPLSLVHYGDYEYDPSHPLDVGPLLPIPVPPFVVLGIRSRSQSWDYDALADSIKGIWNVLGQAAHPEVLIIDSLNVLSEHIERKKTRERHHESSHKESEKESETESTSRETLYKRVTELAGYPNYVFVVLDTPTTSSLLPSAYHQFWEYTSDVIVRLDYNHGTDDYFMRHIEIMKARFQSFSLGRQLLKIFRDPEVEPGQSLRNDPEGPIPNIKRGGIFVFPSEHFVLSKIRAGKPLLGQPQKDPIDTVDTPSSEFEGNGKPLPFGPDNHGVPADCRAWPVIWCAEMVGAFMERNRATALVGKRGLHKSYFGYQFLCDGIANEEHVCVLSFRDDDRGVRSTLDRISKAVRYQGYGIDESRIERFVHVVYQRPGYVTPQELLHRIITAVGEFTPERMLINAVDQWEAGYPLLADSAILLPCLIDFLNTQRVTSMIVGVEEGALSTNTRGLTAKAEVVLSFEHRELPWQRDESKVERRESRGEAQDGYPRGIRMLAAPQQPVDRMGVVVLRAVRVPHGAAGLARGVLEYDPLDDGSPAGLRLVPLAPEYPTG